MSDGGGGAGQGSQRDGAGGYDSDCVVADTFDVGGRSEGMSMASHAGNKRQKTDDAPSSAATLSDEQKRVEDMVMNGRNVRHTLRARADTRWRARAPQPHARSAGKTPICNSNTRRSANRTLRMRVLCQVFFTGSAGVGKSWLLAHLITLLKQRYGEACEPVQNPSRRHLQARLPRTR
jgi:hypothetical protein